MVQRLAMKKTSERDDQKTQVLERRGIKCSDQSMEAKAVVLLLQDCHRMLLVSKPRTFSNLVQGHRRHECLFGCQNKGHCDLVQI